MSVQIAVAIKQMDFQNFPDYVVKRRVHPKVSHPVIHGIAVADLQGVNTGRRQGRSVSADIQVCRRETKLSASLESFMDDALYASEAS